jgi:DNA-binding HxlR family transcriptional regulator
MRWDDVGRQICSLARTTAILGDRWTMLLIREAFLGTRRFDEFRALTGASPQITATRLERLVKAGILRKAPYQERPTRYEYRLTPMGRDLHSALILLMTWGDKWLNDGRGIPNPLRHSTCGEITRPKLVCDCCDEAVGVENLISEPSARMQRQRHKMLAEAAASEIQKNEQRRSR